MFRGKYRIGPLPFPRAGRIDLNLTKSNQISILKSYLWWDVRHRIVGLCSCPSKLNADVLSSLEIILNFLTVYSIYVIRIVYLISLLLKSSSVVWSIV